VIAGIIHKPHPFEDGASLLFVAILKAPPAGLLGGAVLCCFLLFDVWGRARLLLFALELLLDARDRLLNRLEC
jgi:hypothetical protein